MPPPPAHPAAGLPGQRLSPAAEPGQHVLHLRELDLGLALFAARVLGEDVQDQRCPIDHLDPHDALELAQLAGSQLAVADHRVSARRGHQLGQLGGLARSDVGRRIRAAAALRQAIEHLRACRLGEQGELAERVLRLPQRPFCPHAEQYDALKAERPVLDLADVLELGGQSSYAAQRVPLLQVKLTGIVDLESVVVVVVARFCCHLPSMM